MFFFAALSESLLKSPTWDEPPHIAAGLSYVSTGIFRANLQHPPLLKEFSGLSLLLGGIRWPRTPDTDHLLHGALAKGDQAEWDIGKQIIIANGPDRTLFWARLPFLFIASLPALLLYFWGRRMFGGLAALCAAFLYATDPTFLGQAFTVTMDVGLTAFTILFLFALWRYLENPGALRLSVCGLTLGLALCSKFSALLLLPTAAALLAAGVLWPQKAGEQALFSRIRPPAGRNDACPCGSGKKYKSCHGSQPAGDASASSWLSEPVLRAAGTLLVMCLIAAVVIEAVYLFPKDPWIYVHGAQLVNADHRPDYQAYFAGELQNRFPGYFAFAYLLKEPLADIILTVIGLALIFRTKSIGPLARCFLLVPPAVFFIGTSLLADQIGIRYLMPALPFAYLLGGLALAALFTSAAKWTRGLAVALCAWLVLAAAGIYPDHLSYFNESACLLGDPTQVGLDGGSKCGVLWLDDSNVDWGQGLKQLKGWLDRHQQGREIRLQTNYGLPASAYGIRSVTPDIMELGQRPVRGLYVVSAGSVARIPAIAGASDWLRRTPPAAIVGHALYVYDVP